MKSVIHWAIKNSPAMNMILIASLLVGAISMIVMRREVFPEFSLEILLVSVAYPGSTPEECEGAICEKVEAAVSGVDGIKKYTSVAREGFGFLVIELDANVKDVQKVLNEIRSQIDQIRNFPDSVEDPEVRQIVFKIPAISIGILGPNDSQLDPLTQQAQLRELTESVREDLLQLEAAKPESLLRRMFHFMIAPPGRNAISTAEIIAARDYQIDVEVSEERMQDFGLSLEQVAQLIRLNNMEMPGGKMETASQEMLLRSKARREYGDEIAKIEMVSLPNGDAIRVDDVGDVIDGFADSTSVHRVDGNPALVINVARTSDEDLFTVVDTVKKYVAEKGPLMPEGYELKLWNDVSVDVHDRIDLLTKNGLQGLFLVFLVLAIFLELRLAFWVAMGIPISILAAGFILLMTGQTLNMLSMFAFLMALGIVVDDAIVIGENIYAKRELGMKPVQAAVEGTYEVLPSVCASVSTTILAFAPLMFITGVMGKFLAVMPVAVIAMLVISLVESLLILPCHLAHENNLFLRTLTRIFYVFKPLLRPFEKLNKAASRGMEWAVEKFYEPLLRWSLCNKPLVLASSLSLIILSAGVVVAGWVAFEAFPKLDARKISGTVVFPDGTASFEAEKATKKMEAALRAVEEKMPEDFINVVYQRIGEIGNSLGGPSGVTNGSHVGTIEVELVQPDERDIESQDIIDLWREELGTIPGTDVIKFGASAMGPGGNKIEFKLLATNESVDVLEQAAEEAKAWLAECEGVTDIEDDMRVGKYEMVLSLNDKGRSLNLDESRLTRTVRAAYFGEEAMRIQRGRHEVRLMVRFPEEDRKSMASFEEIRVRDANGVELPLTEVADVDVQRANSEINRLNGKRCITVTADVDKSSGANAFKIVNEMKSTFIPDLLSRYKNAGKTLYVSWEGEQQQTMESFSSLGVNFVIVLLMIFILLTLEFRSYIQPLIILSIIPFGFIGAVVGHVFMSLDMTMFSMFGLIALTGVVINDSIVLVDFINNRVREGVPIKEALVSAGKRRFRPIMLTSITTVAGLFPMLLETSLQAQVLIPMAASLVFGLMTGTLLILILVPVFYDIYASVANVAAGQVTDDYVEWLEQQKQDANPALQNG